MGYIAHKALVVVGYDSVKAAHAHAQTLFEPGQVTPVHDTMVNGFESFAVLPCGSKAGWAACDAHESCLAALREFCRSRGLDWALVTFGGDVEFPELEASK